MEFSRTHTMERVHFREEEKRKRRVCIWLRVRIIIGVFVGISIYIRSHKQVMGQKPIMLQSRNNLSQKK